MAKKDYYELLGLARIATAAEIKSAYRKKALEFHPDRNPGDRQAEDMFKLVAEAYEVLSDDKQRGIYDKFGHEGLTGASGFHGFNSSEDIFSAFSDIFEDFFGFGSASSGSRKGQRARRGRDLALEIEIDFMEACFGVEKEVPITRHIPCNSCSGSGARAGSSPQKCSYCNGYGQIQARQGFFTISTACPQCQGAGSFIRDKCPDCRGQGVTREEKKLKVKVPPGVDDGLKLLLKGEGEAGANAGPAGDLYVTLHVAKHPHFVRDGDNIVSSLSISFPEAALGAALNVDTLEGSRELQVKAGIESGERIVLKNAGVANVRSGRRGDHVFIIQVKTPQSLTSRQRELVQQLAQELPSLDKHKSIAKKKKGFFS